MKKLFLHIGAGKTGSSALQIWLYKNHKKLKKQGINYPIFDQKIKSDYQITAGNGVFLINKLREGCLEELFDSFKKDKDSLLFSSETFQILTDKELNFLKDIAITYGYDITIVFYVRDLYDMLYSSYQQLIKRHLYFKSFEEFVLNIKSMQQFDVLYEYETIFKNIKIVHYDSFLDIGIEKPFCEVLGVEMNLLEPMEKRKVNRSLDVFETELLKNVNKMYLEELKEQDSSFCTLLSDSLIYVNPEKNTEIHYTDKILSIIANKFKKDIDYINTKYLSSEKLNIFEKKNKLIVKDTFNIPVEFLIIIKSIFSYLKSKENVGVDNEKVDVIGLLYSEADKREQSNLEEAIQILEVAKILRPNGVIINETLNKYKDNLKNTHASKLSSIDTQIKNNINQ